MQTDRESSKLEELKAVAPQPRASLETVSTKQVIPMKLPAGEKLKAATFKIDKKLEQRLATPTRVQVLQPVETPHLTSTELSKSPEPASHKFSGKLPLELSPASVKEHKQSEAFTSSPAQFAETMENQKSHQPNRSVVGLGNSLSSMEQGRARPSVKERTTVDDDLIDCDDLEAECDQSDDLDGDLSEADPG